MSKYFYYFYITYSVYKMYFKGTLNRKFTFLNLFRSKRKTMNT